MVSPPVSAPLPSFRRRFDLSLPSRDIGGCNRNLHLACIHCRALVRDRISGALRSNATNFNEPSCVERLSGTLAAQHHIDMSFTDREFWGP